MKNIKPSELIELALRDLEEVESDPMNYVVRMGTWHAPAHSQDRRCAVCLAGAVMAVSLKCSKNQHQPTDFPEVTHLLLALDYFRSGYVREGLGCMGRHSDVLIPDRYVTDYSNDPKQFKADMWRMVRDLKQIGL